MQLQGDRLWCRLFWHSCFPATVQPGRQIRDNVATCRQFGNVIIFLRIGAEVVKLTGHDVVGVRILPLDVSVSFRSHAASHIGHPIRRYPDSIAEELAKNCLLPLPCVVGKQRCKAGALELFGYWKLLSSGRRSSMAIKSTLGGTRLADCVDGFSCSAAAHDMSVRTATIGSAIFIVFVPVGLIAA